MQGYAWGKANWGVLSFVERVKWMRAVLSKSKGILFAWHHSATSSNSHSSVRQLAAELGPCAVILVYSPHKARGKRVWQHARLRSPDTNSPISSGSYVLFPSSTALISVHGRQYAVGT